jgi:hypothetical protein
MRCLITVLKSLKPDEFREFGRFTESPFLNGRKETARFFRMIKPYYPEFDDKKMSKESLFKKLYPGKKYDESTIRKLSSFLLKTAESYLAYTGLKEDSFYLELSLAIQLSNRGLYNHSEKKIRQLEDRYNKLGGDYEYYFWKKYMIERHKNAIFAYKGDDHLASEAILKRTNYLSYHMAVMMCKSLISLFINQKNFNANYSKSDFYIFTGNFNFSSYIDELQKQGHDYYSIIAVEYYEAMALLNPESSEYFSRFKTLLKTELSKFSYIEQINLFSIFEAVCTLKIENGEKEYSRDLFEAYREMIDKKLYSYTPGGYFILRIFRNIVHAAINLHEYRWLESFLKKHLNELPPDNIENMGSLARALLLFEKGKYGESLEAVSLIQYELFHLKIDIKNLQLKIFYELGLFDEANSLIDTYKHFISGNRFISERYRTLAGNFVNLTLRLLAARETGDMHDAKKIITEILENRNTLYDEWILEKARGLL